MIIYDSCYSILLDIIGALGGDNTRYFDSVYSQTLYIAGLLGVDTQGKRYDSIYSILLDIIDALGGDNTRYFDSVYSELKYVAELSGCEEKYYDSNYSILLDIVGASPVPPSPCEKDLNIQFAVVTDIAEYKDRIYSKVFAKDEGKWYMLNNLNEYEEYGVYADTFETTTYDGKLTIVDEKEHEYKNGGWQFVGNAEVSKYIENKYPNTSYINTGFKPTTNTRIICEFEQTYPNTYAKLFGSGQYNVSSGYFAQIAGGRDNLLQPKVFGITTTATTTEDIYITDGKHTLEYDRGNIYYDGKLVYEKTYTSKISASYNLLLFNYSKSSTAIGDGTERYYGIIHKCKIYEDDVLVRDYVPDFVDGKYGLRDLVNNTFNLSPNSVDFSGSFIFNVPKQYATLDAPQQIITAATYCDLYKVDNSKLYIGQYGDVEDDDLLYIINNSKRWEEKSVPVYDYDGLTFTALEDGCAVAMNHFGTNASSTKPDLQYTLGDEIWQVWNGEEITLNYGEKIGFKATHISTSTANYSKFVMTGRIAASGNIMSLVDDGECTATTIPTTYYFYYLFNPCPSLVNVDDLTLPATTLKANCYNRMFFGCGFEKAPEILPATALTEGCYYMMFQGCLNLKESPILPAETLVKTCYYQMFNACSSLKKITALFLTTPGTTTSTNQTRNWVSGVPSGATSGGVFVKNVKAFWGVDGVNGVPSGWQKVFYGEGCWTDTTSAQTFTLTGGTFTINMQAEEDTNWNVVSNAISTTGITISQTSGNGAAKIKVTIPQTTYPEDFTISVIPTDGTHQIDFNVKVDFAVFQFDNIYNAGYVPSYWNVVGDELAQDITLSIDDGFEWEITSKPDWITLNKMQGTGTTTISATALKNDVNNFRIEQIIATSRGKEASFDVMQYKYPIVLNDNLKNYYHWMDSNKGKDYNYGYWTTNAFFFDCNVKEITPELYDFTGLKGINGRTDGWYTAPNAYLWGCWGRGTYPYLRYIDIDCTGVVDMRMQGGDNAFPAVEEVILRNTNSVTLGLHLSPYRFAKKMSIGYIPDMTVKTSTSYNYLKIPTMPNLTDFEVERLPIQTPQRTIDFSVCPNLTHQSLLNILNALPDNTESETIQNLQLGEALIAKLTDDEIAIATNKNWALL